MKRLLVGLLLLESAVVSGAAARQSITLAELLGRATIYVAEYENKFSAIVSEEEYIQRMQPNPAGTPPQRVTRGDVLVLNLIGNNRTGFRDVYEVNGAPVRDHTQRLQKLFEAPGGAVLPQASKISEESARYNLGPVRRTINVPTMALLYLRMDNRRRSEFQLGGEETVEGVRARVLKFTETAKPSIVGGRDGDQPAHGAFWIEPDSGRVLRSVMIVGEAWIRVKATIDVTYGPNPKLELWVPIRMSERYDLGRQGNITALAMYSNFRRFSVDANAVIK
jgi:hypothetical protein